MELIMQNKFLHTLESCWLCLRFPFLYPRNRFSGKHHQYMLQHILWKLCHKAITQISIVAKVQKASNQLKETRVEVKF